VAAWSIGVACRVRETTGIGQVCLSGGCFQNALLLQRIVAGLGAQGFDVFTQRAVPCNDGGVSLGQAAVAWALTQN
jgi:hydrogenase maturation protein HypF